MGFFNRFKLSRDDLKAIWALANRLNKLDKPAFYKGEGTPLPAHSARCPFVRVVPAASPRQARRPCQL